MPCQERTIKVGVSNPAAPVTYLLSVEQYFVMKSIIFDTIRNFLPFRQ